MRPFLEVNTVRKAYRMGLRSVEVLRGISVVLERQEFLAIRGASGAGKSTLLHLIGGLDRPDAGEIWLDGQRLDGLGAASLSRFRNHRIGFVFQAYHLFPELDALENVSLPARIARKDAGQTLRKARALLDRVGLGNRVDHKPFELSGGEQQRVAVARALINEPDLVLADEPTGNLDSHTGQEILELLRGLQSEQKTTLVVATHDSRIAAQAPRVIDLVDGLILTN